MKLRKLFASATALALIGSGAALTAASAADASTQYVPLAEIAQATGETEGEVYNQWHFRPADGNPADQVPTEAEDGSGLVFAANQTMLLQKGNGNDIAKTDADAPLADSTSIADLVDSLSIEASATADITFQIPIFFNGREEGDIVKWDFTTLNAPVDSTDGDWTSSKALPAGPDATNVTVAPLSAFIEALDDDARPIAAGFLVWKPAADVTVSSFTVNGDTTNFFAEPVDEDGEGEDGDEEEEWAPSEDDINEFTKGNISVPAEAVEGSDIEITIDTEIAHYFDEVQTFLFSEPVSLGTSTVSEAGTYTVTLPAGVTGEHAVAMYDADNYLVGWDSINITEAEESGSAAQPVAGNEDPAANKEALAATGSETGLVGFAAAALAVVGALALGVSVMRRRVS